jgi:hypothetical protein
LPGADLHDAVRVVDRVRNVRQLDRETDHLVAFESGDVRDLRGGNIVVLLTSDKCLRCDCGPSDRRADLPPTYGHVGGSRCGHVGGLLNLLIEFGDVFTDAIDLVAGDTPVLGGRPTEIAEPALRVDEPGLHPINLAVDTPEFVRYVIDETQLNHQRA